jgi:hypothetical protein
MSVGRRRIATLAARIRIALYACLGGADTTVGDDRIRFDLLRFPHICA